MIFLLLVVASTAQAIQLKNADDIRFLGKKSVQVNVVHQEHLRDSLSFSHVTDHRRIGARQASVRETEEDGFRPIRPAQSIPSKSPPSAPRLAYRGASNREFGRMQYRNAIGVVLVDSPVAGEPLRKPTLGSKQPATPRGDTVVKLLRRTSGGIIGEQPQVPRGVGRTARMEVREKTSKDRALVNYAIKDGGNSHFHKQSRDPDGTVRGSYGYSDADGLYRIVDYEAGSKGYRASIRSNEPGMGRRNPAGVELEVEPPPAAVVARYSGGERPQRRTTARPRPTTFRPLTTTRRFATQRPVTQASFGQTTPPPRAVGFGLSPSFADEGPRDLVDKPKFVRKDKDKGHAIGLVRGTLQGEKVDLAIHTGDDKGPCRCETK